MIQRVFYASGQVVGGLRYSPFGEVVQSSGVASPFGYTGEPQNSVTDLVYLRARYYNPRLGRFLTQDSLIPDLTNGQALNTYAYVYNDPINLVDPSGNSPLGRMIDSIANTVIKPDSDFGKWYTSVPNACTCENEINPWPGQLGTPLNLTTQAVWAVASEPAQMKGHSYLFVQKRPMEFMPGLMGQRQLIPVLPDSKKLISISQAQRGWNGSRNIGTYYISRPGAYSYRVIKPTGAKWAGGFNGLAGTIGISALIDSVFQLYSDLSLPCLTPAQRVNRAALAGWFGALAGLGGAIAFGLATMAGLPVLATIGVSFATGYLLGLGFSWMKNKYFEAYPEAFGT